MGAQAAGLDLLNHLSSVIQRHYSSCIDCSTDSQPPTTLCTETSRTVPCQFTFPCLLSEVPLFFHVSGWAKVIGSVTMLFGHSGDVYQSPRTHPTHQNLSTFAWESNLEHGGLALTAWRLRPSIFMSTWTTAIIVQIFTQVGWSFLRAHSDHC